MLYLVLQQELDWASVLHWIKQILTFIPLR